MNSFTYTKPQSFEIEVPEERKMESFRILARRLLRPSNQDIKEFSILHPGQGDAFLVEEAAAYCFKAIDEGATCLNLNEVTWPDSFSTKNVVEALIKSPYCNVSKNQQTTAEVQQNILPLQLEISSSETPWLYLNKYWYAEKIIAEQIILRQTRNLTGETPSVELVSKAIQSHDLLKIGEKGCLSPMQVRALGAITQKGFIVLTGGPGTGKTTTVARMIEILRQTNPEKRLDIKLAAPTGKAANRLKESIQSEAPSSESNFYSNLEAVTLHKLLGARPGVIENFKYDAKNKLSGDVFIIDEASMISLLMFKKFLEAIPQDAKVIVIGDPDQLASVEVGTVLADIVKGMQNQARRDISMDLSESIKLDNALKKLWEKTATSTDEQWPNDHSEASFIQLHNGLVALTQGHRNTGGVSTLVKLINDQDIQKAIELLKSDEKNVTLIDSLNSNSSYKEELIQHYKNLSQKVSELYKQEKDDQISPEELDQQYAILLDEMNNLRLLCAKKRGTKAGTNSIQEWNALISKEIEKEFGSTKSDIDAYGECIGSVLVVRKNQSTLDINNGDTGLLVKRVLQEGEDSFKLVLPGTEKGTVRYVSRPQIEAAELGYAITIHKSQGSEYKHALVMLTNEADSPLNLRELIYTGVSRAKQKVTVIGSEEVLEQGLTRQVERASRLDELLGQQ
jgi:exodeoxyribonuclease V, alpha subunit